jgi:hypothetical protein
LATPEEESLSAFNAQSAAKTEQTFFENRKKK